jgi:hypothetical protein
MVGRMHSQLLLLQTAGSGCRWCCYDAAWFTNTAWAQHRQSAASSACVWGGPCFNHHSTVSLSSTITALLSLSDIEGCIAESFNCQNCFLWKAECAESGALALLPQPPSSALLGGWTGCSVLCSCTAQLLMYTATLRCASTARPTDTRNTGCDSKGRWPLCGGPALVPPRQTVAPVAACHQRQVRVYRGVSALPNSEAQLCRMPESIGSVAGPGGAPSRWVWC